MKKTLNINENNVTVCITKLDLEKFQCFSFENTSSYDLKRVENMIETEIDNLIIKHREKAEEEILIFLYKIIHRKDYTNRELFIEIGNVTFKLYYNDMGIKIEISQLDMDIYSEFVDITNICDISSCLYQILTSLDKICLEYAGDSILYNKEGEE